MMMMMTMKASDVRSLAVVVAGLLSRGLAAAADTTGQFNILSFNVAGLPEIFNDNEVPGDKTTNARTIGSMFAEYGYDVIHVQEVCPPFGFLSAPPPHRNAVIDATRDVLLSYTARMHALWM